MTEIKGRWKASESGIEMTPDSLINRDYGQLAKDIRFLHKVNPGAGFAILSSMPNALSCSHYNDPRNPQPDEYARCMIAVNQIK